MMSLRPKQPKRTSTMFGPPKHPGLAKIIRIDTPANAQYAIDRLTIQHRESTSDQGKIRIERAMRLASSRADATLKRKTLSTTEHTEMTLVRDLYSRATDLLRQERLMSYTMKPT